MFIIIYCLLPIFLIVITMYLLTTRESVSWNVKRGKSCYSCKIDLGLSNEEIIKRLGDTSDKHLELCLSCVRDQKLSLIVSPISSLKFKFQRFLFSEKSETVFYYFAGVAFFFIVLDVILMIFGIKTKLNLTYLTLNLFFWIFTTYKIIYTSQKKP